MWETLNLPEFASQPPVFVLGAGGGLQTERQPGTRSKKGGGAR